ncbi:MAG: type II toxin-antitoxin system Phd/YefM family antitoxin [Solirubrobacteraceae bacterium]
MTKSVGVHEAKTHLSRLVDRALAGEDIVITRRGEEVVRLVPTAPRRPRVFGIDQGVWSVPEDFDEPLPPEMQKYFE